MGAYFLIGLWSRSSLRIRLPSCVDLSLLHDLQKLQIAALGLRTLPNCSSHSSDYADCWQITRYFTSCTVSSQREVTALIPGWVLSGSLPLRYFNDVQVGNLVRYVMNLISTGCSPPLLGQTPVPFTNPYRISGGR